MDETLKKQLEITACKVRLGILEGVFNAKSGHPGGSLSIADLLTYLYFAKMNVYPDKPEEPERDKLVLSKGHTAPALYATLAEKGFFPKEELKSLRHIGAMLQGHPCISIPGVDMSSGSLGQGISVACGMALSGKLTSDTYKVYTILGDGEIEEGQVWEAAMFAAHYKLDNLVAVVDNNGLQIDGKIEDVMSPYPIVDKFEAFRLARYHSRRSRFLTHIEKAFNEAETVSRSALRYRNEECQGQGRFIYGKQRCHGMVQHLTQEQYEQAVAEINEQLKSTGGLKQWQN